MSKITLKILIQTLSVDVLGDICWSYGPPFGRFLLLHAMALPLNVLTMSELGTLNTCLYSKNAAALLNDDQLYTVTIQFVTILDWSDHPK